jgi:hypothetical protein
MRWGCLAIAIAIALPFPAYLWTYPLLHPVDPIFFRLTVTVHTPTGDRQGSGIWAYRREPTFSPGLFFLEPKWVFNRRFEGEAIRIDLGQGEAVYAVLGQRSAPNQPGERAGFTLGYSPIEPLWHGGYKLPSTYGRDQWQQARDDAAWANGLKGQAVELDCISYPRRNPRGDCPALVAVDRRSADPAATLLDQDDLAAALGTGSYLRSMSLTITNGPVTRTLAKTLPWIEPLRPRDAEQQCWVFPRPRKCFGFSLIE